MFNKKTVVVIGAGASEEAKLPTGKEIKEIIAKLLDIRFEDGISWISGDRTILNALKIHVRLPDGHPGDINPYLLAGWTIRDAMPQAMSIDNFMDAHNGDKKIELCGKLSIVRTILQAEKKSCLYVDSERRGQHPDYQLLAVTWFTSFMQLLTENCRLDDLADRVRFITLIVFNYDRCIEHFLYHSLQTYYRVEARRAAEIVNAIEIYHPYGTVGHLPWQNRGKSVDFGEEPSAEQLLSSAEQIKTFAEGTDTNSSDILKIRQRVMEADILVFLGFAFHYLNLKLLTPVASSTSVSTVGSYDYFATAFGISKSDCEIIKNDLARMKGAEPTSANLRNDLKCNELFREYWRSLSLSR